MKTLPETLSAYGDRAVGGYFLDFDINREAAARYGLTTGDVQDVIQSAIGGMNITETVEGLERYPVNLRYPRDLRDNLEALAAGINLHAHRQPDTVDAGGRYYHTTRHGCY